MLLILLLFLLALLCTTYLGNLEGSLETKYAHFSLTKQYPATISSISYVLLIICFCVIVFLLQIVIVLGSATASPSKPAFIYTSPPSQHVEVFCNFGNGFISSCVYNFIIISACCGFAFKARRVPSNYNESKFIAVSVYSTLLVCLAAAPVYTTAVVAKQKVATLCMVLLVNAFLTVSCVYLPKIYAIRFVEDDLNVQEWRTTGMSNSSRSTMNSTHTVSSSLQSSRVHPVPLDL